MHRQPLPPRGFDGTGDLRAVNQLRGSRFHLRTAQQTDGSVPADPTLQRGLFYVVEMRQNI